jgi:hypothetical protein
VPIPSGTDGKRAGGGAKRTPNARDPEARRASHAGDEPKTVENKGLRTQLQPRGPRRTPLAAGRRTHGKPARAGWTKGGNGRENVKKITKRPSKDEIHSHFPQYSKNIQKFLLKLLTYSVTIL